MQFINAPLINTSSCIFSMHFLSRKCVRTHLCFYNEDSASVDLCEFLFTACLSSSSTQTPSQRMHCSPYAASLSFSHTAHSLYELIECNTHTLQHHCTHPTHAPTEATPLLISPLCTSHRCSYHQCSSTKHKHTHIHTQRQEPYLHTHWLFLLLLHLILSLCRYIRLSIHRYSSLRIPCICASTEGVSLTFYRCHAYIA